MPVTQAEFDIYCAAEQLPAGGPDRATALAAAKRAVYGYTQRTYDLAGESATARTYVPTGSDILRIHDCVAVTGITVDGATVASTSYQVEPTTVDWSGLSRPYEQVRYLLGYWYGATPGKAAVSVTARWGWTAVPDEVPEAVKQLGRLHILRRRMGLDEAEYRQILTRLDDLRRVEAFGVA